MHKLLNYPFDAGAILKKRKAIRRKLLENNSDFSEVKIAILGGSTTNDIKDILELFLLNQGFKPSFYESAFGQYWQDAMFENKELILFQPDIIFVHTSNRNIEKYPALKNSEEEISALLDHQYKYFEVMWDKLATTFNCPIIQNNFEMPFYRLLGNTDVSDIHGHTNYVTCLNSKLYKYAQSHKNFYINDINYLSADYGLKEWLNPFYWHMYKYSLCVPAIPYLSFSVSNIIKSLYGKNKKALVLDLDNTLWSGVIGDDGIDGIEIGHETPLGEIYSEFQGYLKSLKELGIMLNVNSKNDYEYAMAGLNHIEGILNADEFIVIKANWENKDTNISQIANELNLSSDSIVFIDDNPAERDLIKNQLPNISVPDLGSVENYIEVIDRSGFFEVTNFSDDDIKRNEMYKENIQRTKYQQNFKNYDKYLKSLEMIAVIKEFENIYLPRIVQLINKTNQFNLTTKRYTENEMEAILHNDNYIKLYGKLKDKFGDNGIVTVVIGKKSESTLDIILWLMSCRVLKRGMEYAMLDELVEKAKECNINKLRGHYYSTTKNPMVKDFYGKLGFQKINEKDNGDTAWELDITSYNNKNSIIKVVGQNG